MTNVTMKQKVAVGIVIAGSVAGAFGMKQCSRLASSSFASRQVLLERAILEYNCAKNPDMKPYLELISAKAKLAGLEGKFKDAAKQKSEPSFVEKVRLATEAETTREEIAKLEHMEIGAAHMLSVQSAMEDMAAKAAKLRKTESYLIVEIEKSQDINEVADLQKRLKQVMNEINELECASPVDYAKAKEDSDWLKNCTIHTALFLGMYVAFLKSASAESSSIKKKVFAWFKDKKEWAKLNTSYLAGTAAATLSAFGSSYVAEKAGLDRISATTWVAGVSAYVCGTGTIALSWLFLHKKEYSLHPDKILKDISKMVGNTFLAQACTWAVSWGGTAFAVSLGASNEAAVLVQQVVDRVVFIPLFNFLNRKRVCEMEKNEGSNKNGN